MVLAVARFLLALGMDGRTLPKGTEERTALFRSVVADRRVLVILDDAVDEPQVRPLLPSGTGCAVLVTSGRALGGLGAEHVGLGALSPRSGLMLLARIAGTRLALRPHWSIGRLTDSLRPDRRRLDERDGGELRGAPSRVMRALSASLITRTGADRARNGRSWLAATAPHSVRPGTRVGCVMCGHESDRRRIRPTYGDSPAWRERPDRPDRACRPRCPARTRNAPFAGPVNPEGSGPQGSV
jgi:hypothetical protein